MKNALIMIGNEKRTDILITWRLRPPMC